MKALSMSRDSPTTAWFHYIRNSITQKKPKAAILTYIRGRGSGSIVIAAFPLVLKACASLSMISFGKALHSEILKSDEVTLVSVLPACAQTGNLDVMTTRLSNVGDCIGSWSLAISFLAEDKSWDLFCEKAFGGHGCPVELEDCGKKIVKKCKGLPLAIVVVASHLGKLSMKQEYWDLKYKSVKGSTWTLVEETFPGLKYLRILNVPY